MHAPLGAGVEGGALEGLVLSAMDRAWVAWCSKTRAQRGERRRDYVALWLLSPIQLAELTIF